MANVNFNEVRNYHNYLISRGYTSVGGGKYYKDGNFFVPHFYNFYATLELLGAEGILCKEIEQMFYLAMEGGVAVC